MLGSDSFFNWGIKNFPKTEENRDHVWTFPYNTYDNDGYPTAIQLYHSQLPRLLQYITK